MSLETGKMDNLDDIPYHLRFRPRAIWGRRPRPNGGHRRPRPICGVYTSRYAHVNPASGPIDRGPKFQEMVHFPDPVPTGDSDWDEGNYSLKDLFENVAKTRLQIHLQTPVSSKEATEILSFLWSVTEHYLERAKDVSTTMRKKGQIPYPQPDWFASRDTTARRSLDLNPWIQTVSTVAGSAKDGLDLTIGGNATTNAKEDLALSSDDEGELKAQWALGA